MNKFEPLNFPPISLRTQIQNQQTEAWDRIRKKWVKLTPEEWVRQHVVHFLIDYRQFPEGLMTVEGSIRMMNLDRRFDILVRNAQGAPHLLVECKAPQVKLDEQTFRQIVNYNRVFNVHNLLITNGISHFFCILNPSEGKWQFLQDIPNFNQLPS